MFGLDFTEIFIIITLLIPLGLVVAGVVVMTVYTLYLIVKDSFEHGFHLPHRKAH